MIQIAICDDELLIRKELREIIMKALFQYDEVDFHEYASGDELINSITQGDFHSDLLFLDIQMPGKNGLETAEYIRSHKIDTDIIFVTVSQEHVFDGYLYQAFSYLLKPLDRHRFLDELGRYMRLKRGNTKCLHVKIGNKTVPIFLDKVKYFSADGRKCIVHQYGKEENIEFYAKMGELEETLERESFLRCHQSYLVNIDYVETVTRTFVLIDGEEIPVSRRYAVDVKNAFAE